jgi:rSAM/selenodomain-associated transferase 2
MEIVLPPAVSIIVPVLNEADTINEFISHLVVVSAGCNTEIIVVDGDPDGSTIQKIHSREVKAIISPPGRGTQMNAGAAAASGTVFLFVHADTLLPADAIECILDACHRRRAAGGAFLLGIDNKKPIFRMIEAWANIRSVIAKIPYGDQAIFIRSNVFLRLGGYGLLPIMEDIDIVRRLKKQGLSLRILNKPVLTSARRWEKDGVVYCIIRNNLLSNLYHAGVKASRLKRFYM